MSTLAQRYHSVLSKLPMGTSLLAVSKTFSADDVKALYDLGQRHFGENKVQELSLKANQLKALCPDIQWHFIGHLQSNKVKALLLVPQLTYIHSVDSEKLWSELIKQESQLRHTVKVMVEVNISGESNKSGLPADVVHLTDFVRRVKSESTSSHFQLVGLMGMGPIQTTDFVSETAKSFQLLRYLRDQIDPQLLLSMGMSQDFEIALQYGSNWVRIGSFLFGSRII